MSRITTTFLKTATLSLMVAATMPAYGGDANPVAGAPKVTLADETVLTRIAFGSCADEEKAQPIWNVIKASNPDLFLFIGDNVYADRNRDDYIQDYSREELLYSYRIFATHPDFTPFYATTPMMVTWDDHDYGKNDAGAEFEMKDEIKDIFLDFFQFDADDPVRTREGIYNARIFGTSGKRVQIIMLDTRWSRSALKRTDDYGAKGKERYVPSDDSAQQMLGAQQWQWLQDELQKPADVRLIASSVQVLADGHGWEAWRHMPKEREKLYGMLDKANGGKAIILSGDRHVGGLYKNTDALRYPLYEITSSSLNVSFNDEIQVQGETGPNLLSPLFGPENFGLIDIDWQAETLSLRLQNNVGDTVRTVIVPFHDAGSE